MNPAQLLAHFDRISEAPDAVPRLRRFILDLAVRGKLVEQVPDDEPALELLDRSFGRRWVGAGPDLAWGSIPRAWQHTAFGRILSLEYGKALPASSRNEGGAVAVYGSNGIVGHHDESLVATPAIIVGRKGSAGALNLAQGPSWTTDVAYYLVPPPCFERRFLFVLLSTLRLEQLSRGIKPGLNRRDVYSLPIVVPPLAEQHRIVAKVDELMALCDRLEAGQTEREARRDRVVAASLNRLNEPAADGAHSFRDHASFHLRHLPRLTTRPEHIQQLRQTILNLAVRGRLAPQDPTDEPACILIERLAADARAYARERGISAAVLEPIELGATEFDLPAGWLWTRLCRLFRAVTDGDHQPPPKCEKGVPFLTIGNVTTGRVEFSGCRFVPREYLDSVAEHRRPAYGDILFTVVGATYGRPAFVGTRREFCVQRHIAMLKPGGEIDAAFLCYLLASPLVYEQATRSVTGTAQPTIPIRSLRNFLVPLPPLAEQHRIVAKVDELMALCDRLEAQVTSAQTESRRLLEAVLHQALSPVA